MGLYSKTKELVSRALTPAEINAEKWGLISAFAFRPNVYGIGGVGTEGTGQTFDIYANNFYMRDSVLFSVAEARRRVFSQAKFKWRRVGEADRGHNLFGTPELELLEHPWPGGSTSQLLSRMIQDVDLCGNTYWAKEFDPGTRKMRLRRLRPDWVDIVLTVPDDIAVKSDIAGYAYYPGGYQTGRVEVYFPNEVIHWAPIPDPQAQYRGMTWITPIIPELLTDRAATKHRISFFERGAQPSMIVQLRDRVTKDQMREFQEIFMSEAAGVENQNAPLFVGAGADVKPWEVSLRDLDLTEVSGRVESRIAAAAGVPPSVVGFLEGSNTTAFSADNSDLSQKMLMNMTIRTLWSSLVDTIDPYIPHPEPRRRKSSPVYLWYSTEDVAILDDDKKTKTEIMTSETAMVNTLVREGWTAESSKEYVMTQDISVLKHSGFLSVQIQPSAKVNPDGSVEYMGPSNTEAEAIAEKAKADAEKAKAETEQIKKGRSEDDASAPSSDDGGTDGTES